jgi:hypothetical protein
VCNNVPDRQGKKILCSSSKPRKEAKVGWVLNVTTFLCDARSFSSVPFHLRQLIVIMGGLAVSRVV